MCDATSAPSAPALARILKSSKEEEEEPQIEPTNLIWIGHQANLDYEELALYLLVIIVASIHLFLIFRYFVRLRKYFNRLQKEIEKNIN